MNVVGSRFDGGKLKDDKNKVEIVEEKEEGEISLEDVSSSEEGQLNSGYVWSQCPNCLSTQHCATWCTVPGKHYYGRSQGRDAVHGKENRHHIKESGSTGMKHSISTLQEKNDDLISISTDSDMDMETIGLTDNLPQIALQGRTKVRLKKKKRKRNPPMLTSDDLVSPASMNIPDCVSGMKHEKVIAKSSSLSRHYRDLSPSHISSRSRLGTRSPPRRHRSPIRTRSPFKKSRSPFKRSRSPMRGRSPIRGRSPLRGRSPIRGRSPMKISRKAAQVETSRSSYGHVDGHGNVNELLKRIGQLDNIGTKSIEETLHKNKQYASSLKEKLINMMKGISDNNANVPNYSNKTSIAYEKQKNDVDEEEDLALLRQKALATKQKKTSKRNDQAKVEPEKKPTTSLEDDQDEEDLKLRMIALRSAVMKKHQNRVQRGLKCGKTKKSNPSRSESPFTQSFLDTIPIPEEQSLNFASPPHTPHSLNDNNHTEDMKLDTDVEREKEELPYSPTDKISIDMSMDTELLGIQSSDVSFISLNDANNSAAFLTATDPKSLQEKIKQTQSYLPDVPQYYAEPLGPVYDPADLKRAYSPTDPIVTPKPNYAQAKIQNTNVPMPHYIMPCDIFTNMQNTPVHNPMDVGLSMDIPYSPSHVLQSLPPTPCPVATSNNTTPIAHRPGYASNVHRNLSHYNCAMEVGDGEASKEASVALGVDDNADTLSMEPAIGSAGTSTSDSISLSYSTVTVDDLPEIDNPSSDSQKNAKTTDNIPRSTPQNVKEIVPEPLYMQGVPDITKDANKIPTLINKTFVPAPILKSNKQLQQPMPARKHETHPEPTFKSAEMQPVTIAEETSTRPNTVFKPMKLTLLSQKSTSVLTTPVAFHDSLQEDSTDETRPDEGSKEENKNDSIIQNVNDSNTSSDQSSSVSKQKKSTKSAHKRKNSVTQSDPKKVEALPNDSNEEEQKGTIESRDKSQYNDVASKKNKLLTNVLKNAENPGERNKEENSSKEATNDSSKTLKNLGDKRTNQKDNKADAIPKENTAEKNKGGHTGTESTPHTTSDLKAAENRRQSLEEDEEELRAILLASLPKRTKVADSNNTDKTIAATNATTDQDISKPPLPATSVVHSRVETTEQSKLCALNNDKMQAATGSNDRTKNLETESVPPTISSASRKRPAAPLLKGPQKKIIKKISIPASTKVVNNAKKYQNAMMQKRQNLQKEETIYNNQKLLENKAQISENKWATGAKASQLGDTQRIVINLESDTESDSEPERQMNSADQSAALAAVAALTKQQSVLNPGAFKKNLDQFLRDVRKKQECMAAARTAHSPQSGKKDVTPTPVEKTNSTNLHTPLAVRHLPASQQEEYRRLKQQIIEREKLRLRRTIENNTTKNKTVAAVSPKSNPSNNTNNQPHVPKVQQTTQSKNQISNTGQLNKENNLKSEESMTITVGNVRKVQPVSANSVNSVKLMGSPQSNSTAKPVTNLSVRILNEKAVPSNSVSKAGRDTISTTTTRTATENALCTQENALKTKTSSLKVLSKDEVNRRYVQVQVKQGVDGRAVTINDNKSASEISNINIGDSLSGNRKIDKELTEEDISHIVETVEKEIVANDGQSTVSVSTVDSDASTIILPRNGRNIYSSDSIDSSQSTILLSHLQGDTQLSQPSISDANDDNSLSLRSNSSLDSKISIEENWDIIRKDVKVKLSALNNLSLEQQEQQLTETEQHLVMKRYTILDELMEMSGNLRQWHMERDLQTNLVAEVKKLREQLRLAEESLQVQRNRIHTIGPKVIAAHEKINAGRQECFKLSQVCLVLGTRVIGKDYKVPEAGAQLLENRLKEVANHTRQLSKKKVPSIDIPEITTPSPTKMYLGISSADNEPAKGHELSQHTDVSTTVEHESDRPTETTVEVEIPSQIEPEVLKKEKTNENINEKEDEAVNHDVARAEPVAEHSITSDQDNTILDAQPEQCSTPIVPRSNRGVQNNAPENAETDLTHKSSEKKNTNTDTETQSKKMITPYISILSHFKAPRCFSRSKTTFGLE